MSEWSNRGRITVPSGCHRDDASRDFPIHKLFAAESIARMPWVTVKVPVPLRRHRMATAILAADLSHLNSVLCWFEPDTRETERLLRRRG